MKLDITLGCKSCKERKEKLKKLLVKAREQLLGKPRARNGKNK